MRPVGPPVTEILWEPQEGALGCCLSVVMCDCTLVVGHLETVLCVDDKREERCVFRRGCTHHSVDGNNGVVTHEGPSHVTESPQRGVQWGPDQ